MTAAVETFVCECDTPERRPYIVTGHDGVDVVCRYCDDCAYLARVDWNGETAAIRPLTWDEETAVRAADPNGWDDPL